MKKRFLGLLAVLSLLMSVASPVFANGVAIATAVEPGVPSAWAVRELFDAEAYELVESSDYLLDLHKPVTQSAMDYLLKAVDYKLSVTGLGASESPVTDLPVDLTRQGVMNALYMAVAAYDFSGIDMDAVEYLQSIGVVKGDHTGLALERECTLQEALCMGQRIITTLYEYNAFGSAGLLWKATNGSNTLYLLGTIHVDQGNIYPFDYSLREALDSADAVYFEIDFGDEESLLEYSALMMYSDGTTLKDHVSSETYEYIVGVAALLGMTEEETAMFKPWVLANSFSALMLVDESTGSTQLAMDMYIYLRALINGQTIGQVESYAFQGQLFDNLSDEYQEEYLLANAQALEQFMSGEAPEEEETEELSEQEMLDAMIKAWKNRSVDEFTAVYDKDGMVDYDDELSALLFEGRDPAMILAAEELLKTEGENIFFLAVGAGHMVGSGGIVQGLIDLGYTVELVPVG